ncbi:M20/M25/M40 family metallo-hydrolase [Nocardiopsis halophila]|uniref:M20/M25/M40 family metallo-hydrolase n=1 Tax=Nocardiopsis halophila TaxID=141692 RepID=UPI00034B9482|nr:M20/M25/M40 family metallo-hydrolase [Nocardiopsis halophila]
MRDIARTVEGLAEGLRSDLVDLARIPSIAFPGHPEAPVLRARDRVAELLRSAGMEAVGSLELPGSYPVVTGSLPAPEGAPTVLLYAHYDVQPPGDESAWESPPFEPTEFDAGPLGPAVRARGIADDKSNILVHIGALRVFGGRPPVGVKVVIEGQEEYGGPLDEYPPSDPELFGSDAMVIADMGNVRPGVPTFTVALRGDAEVVVEVRTLDGPRHSGEFGGAAPDALIALLHALSTLHDADGNVAVSGLLSEEWDGATLDEEEFRRMAGVRSEAPLIGTGSLGRRLWTGPAITVMGLDAPAVDTAAAAVVPYARAKINLRVHPGQDAAEAQRALVRHLEGLRPFGIPLQVTAGDAGSGFAAQTGGPAYSAATEAMRAAWGAEPVHMASGGAIPLVSGLAKAVPGAEILLFGAQDSESNLHAPNERVLLEELKRAVVAEAVFFQEYARRHREREDAR